MKNLMKQLKNEEIKNKMFELAAKDLDSSEQKVYGWLFDELEGRLVSEDFDYFLDQLDVVIAKARAAA